VVGMARYDWSLLHDVVANKRRKPVLQYHIGLARWLHRWMPYKTTCCSASQLSYCNLVLQLFKKCSPEIVQ
jgi:hypothetical protein